jgi:hypothetical protein
MDNQSKCEFQTDRREFQVKHIRRYLPLLVAGAISVAVASAQSTFDVNIGFGAVQDSASSSGLDYNGVTGVFFNCQFSTDPTCIKTSSLSGFDLGIGGSLMLWKHFGVGADVGIQTGRQNYATFQQQVVSQQIPGFALQTRMTLYDFDGIFQPLRTKKAAVQIRGGLGGANLRFYENQTATDALAGATNYSQYFESSNHFQVHGGLGVQIYLTDHFFVRPEFDIHWVNNLNQFGRNIITQELVWVGYSFGGQ